MRKAPHPFMTKDRESVTDRAIAGVSFTPASSDEIGFLVKALGVDQLPDGYIAGWASTPAVDSNGHIVEKGAFSAAIKSRGLTGPRGIKFLLGHDWDKPSGAIKVLEYRGDRLWIEAQLNLNISYARDAYEATKSAGGMSFSVGFFLQDYEFREDPSGNEVLVIKRADLFEVSLVPFPANEECGMEFMKSAKVGAVPLKDPKDWTISDFEKLLVAKGFAQTRSEAHRIVECFKEHAPLFKWGEKAKVEPKPSPAPMIGADTKAKLDALALQVAELRAAVAPAAK